MTSNKLHNLSTSAIRRELDQIMADTAEWLRRAAQLLVVLRERGESHPLMQSHMLRFYHEISNGKLDPQAVLNVGGNRNLLKVLKTVSMSDQIEYTNDRKVQVVEKTSDGETIASERHIMHLDQKTLNRVFGSDGLRSVTEQKALIEKESVIRNVEGFRINTDEKRILIANRKISPLDLVAPLRALGFEIRKIK